VIVTITEHESMLARQRGIVGAPLQRIYYGLPDTNSPPPQRLGGDGPLEFLFVGRLDRQKGLDWLLECWPQLPASDFRLTVVGSALHSGNAVQRDLPNVHYTGWIDNAMLDGYFDRADAVVMPSRWEGFGLVAAEAMRRGVPVLVSDRGALAEVIGGDEAGKVFSLSSSASFIDMARSLQREELRRLGRQGRVRFEQLFRSERMNQETDALYRQILSSVARKSAIPPRKS
ncbi:MAG TPA: glycosyltransferase family 4 protein, partial [Rhodocyclaceae bacterium]